MPDFASSFDTLGQEKSQQVTLWLEALLEQNEAFHALQANAVGLDVSQSELDHQHKMPISLLRSPLNEDTLNHLMQEGRLETEEALTLIREALANGELPAISAADIYSLF